MIKFKALGLEDRALFQKYLKNYTFKTYEYSFLTLYLWKKYCNVEYAVIDDSLVLKKTEEKIGSFFMQPIGYSEEKLSGIIEELIKIKQEDPGFKALFRDIEEPFMKQLTEIYGSNILFLEDVKNFDYIYETERLIHLPGEKLHKRKNHYNQFINSYSYEVKDIHDQVVIDDCLGFASRWYENQKVKSRQLLCELEGIKDVLNHLEDLEVIGMAVYVDGKIAGFTFGEKVNSKMAVIHIEKGNTKYKGIYAFINKTFAENYLHNVMYINREEDLGILGLRKAKLAYDPIKLEKKFIVSPICCETGYPERMIIRA